MNEQNGNESRTEARTVRRHPLTENEQRHIAEIQTTLKQHRERDLRMKGAIWDKEQNMLLLRRHLTFYVGTIAQAARLQMGIMLSPEGTR
jgi:hypothetical protein